MFAMRDIHQRVGPGDAGAARAASRSTPGRRPSLGRSSASWSAPIAPLLRRAPAQIVALADQARRSGSIEQRALSAARPSCSRARAVQRPGVAAVGARRAGAALLLLLHGHGREAVAPEAVTGTVAALATAAAVGSTGAVGVGAVAEDAGRSIAWRKAPTRTRAAAHPAGLPCKTRETPAGSGAVTGGTASSCPPSRATGSSRSAAPTAPASAKRRSSVKPSGWRGDVSSERSASLGSHDARQRHRLAAQPARVPRPPERLRPASEALVSGAAGDLQALDDLAHGDVVEIVQREDDPLLGRELFQRLLDERAHGSVVSYFFSQGRRRPRRDQQGSGMRRCVRRSRATERVAGISQPPSGRDVSRSRRIAAWRRKEDLLRGDRADRPEERPCAWPRGGRAGRPPAPARRRSDRAGVARGLPCPTTAPARENVSGRRAISGFHSQRARAR